MSKISDESEKQKTSLRVTRYENPWLEAAAEASDDLGRLLKFVKGKFGCGDDEIPLGTEFVAHIDQIVRGWVRFEDGKVVDRSIGKVADGFKPPLREELADNDPASWTEKDANGKPRDPWVAQWFLPLSAWRPATSSRLSPARKAASLRFQICAASTAASMVTGCCRSWR